MKWKLETMFLLQMNHETLYLKQAFGPSIEFPSEAGVFQLDAFPDLTASIVLSEEPRVVQANFASAPNASGIASTPNTCTITTRVSRNLSKRAYWHAQKSFELTWTTMGSLQM